MTETIILTLLGAGGFGITSAVGWLVMQLEDLKKENKELKARIDHLEDELVRTKSKNKELQSDIYRLQDTKDTLDLILKALEKKL